MNRMNNDNKTDGLQVGFVDRVLCCTWMNWWDFVTGYLDHEVLFIFTISKLFLVRFYDSNTRKHFFLRSFRVLVLFHFAASLYKSKAIPIWEINYLKKKSLKVKCLCSFLILTFFSFNNIFCTITQHI